VKRLYLLQEDHRILEFLWKYSTSASKTETRFVSIDARSVRSHSPCSSTVGSNHWRERPCQIYRTAAW